MNDLDPGLPEWMSHWWAGVYLCNLCDQFVEDAPEHLREVHGREAS